MQKLQNLIVFFLRLPSGVTNFNTPPTLPFPFENFLLDALRSEEKPSVKKTVDRAGQKPVDRPAGEDFEIYRSGRVEKILTGSISVLQHWQAVDNIVSNLTGPKFEPQTSRSKDELVTASQIVLVTASELVTASQI